MTLRQHRSHTVSRDCVVKTVSKNLDSNLLVLFDSWTLYQNDATKSSMSALLKDSVKDFQKFEGGSLRLMALN